MPDHPTTPEGRFGWVSSIAFWVCLSFSAALYAAVSLAPKLLTCVELGQQQHVNQLRLVALEEDDRRVERIIAALKDDPRYARELARQDFAAEPSSEENRIHLDPELSVEARPAAPQVEVQEPELPWYTPFVALVARDTGLATSLLIVAAVVVVYAFAFLHPAKS